MKNQLLLSQFFILFLVILFYNALGQTNVSGGIYANATWTKANSPYIVTDSIVVFPGITLTIEPGVTVMFANGKRIEIRNGSIIARGTSTEPITYTSLNGSTPGIWEGIYLNNHSLADTADFNYCNFSYANKALNTTYPGNTPFLHVRNSNFTYNNSGIFVYIFLGIKSCNIDSCTFSHNVENGFCAYYNPYLGYYGRFVTINHSFFSNNGTAVFLPDYGTIKNSVVDSNIHAGIYMSGNFDSIINCSIRNNGYGIGDTATGYSDYISKNIIKNNKVGMTLTYPSNKILCNEICNNVPYNIVDLFVISDINLSGNNWCTSDSIAIRSTIYDGYKNITYGLVNYMPVDTLNCSPKDSDIATKIDNRLYDNQFLLFPNPASNNVTITLPVSNPGAIVRVYNSTGITEMNLTTIELKTNLDISRLGDGIHIVEVVSGKGIFRQKLIKQ